MPPSDEYWRLDAACRIIAAGRSLARQLTNALQEHQLSEAEFRLLWQLYQNSSGVRDASIQQSAFAEPLGISLAQVSAIVEKLRTRRFIASAAHAHDRRRRLWQLTSTGRQHLETIVKQVGRLSESWVFFGRSHEGVDAWWGKAA